MADRMLELAAQQPGYLGVESARTPGGLGITVSCSSSDEAIGQWRSQAEHRVTQERGRSVWYSDFYLRVVRVERSHGMVGSFQSPFPGSQPRLPS
jgi:heme-degrading monooxygenase HmoA